MNTYHVPLISDIPVFIILIAFAVAIIILGSYHGLYKKEKWIENVLIGICILFVIFLLLGGANIIELRFPPGTIR